MAKTVLLTGSVFGTATLTSEEIAGVLASAGHEVNQPETPSLESITDTSVEILVVCTSSTGNGDVPDNLAGFYQSLVTEYPRITHLKYAVVALGDSSYETFCGAGLAIDAALEDLGAGRLAEPLKIDAMEEAEPETVAPDWVVALLAKS